MCKRCPKCGVKLENVGCYKWDCPNGCLPMAMELWKIETMGESKERLANARDMLMRKNPEEAEKSLMF